MIPGTDVLLRALAKDFLFLRHGIILPGPKRKKGNDDKTISGRQMIRKKKETCERERKHDLGSPRDKKDKSHGGGCRLAALSFDESRLDGRFFRCSV